MKSLIISISCVIILFVGWGIYANYSHDTLHGFGKDIDDKLMNYIIVENWEQANQSFEDFEDEWHKYKKVALFFFDTDKVNESDYSIAKCKYYIKAEDVSNASGELACLKEQLSFLHLNQSLSIENIF